MKNKIKIVHIDNKYIDYLYNFDKRVMYNKDQKRPYIGILFEVNGLKYYAPLSSPKEKFLKMHNNIDIMKINEGLYGVINFNNMIPVQENTTKVLDTKDIQDYKYRLLVNAQLIYFNKHQEEIISKATNLYTKYNNNKLPEIIRKRCCNFKYLEQVAEKYTLE